MKISLEKQQESISLIELKGLMEAIDTGKN
jgi:hypothetical protein